MLRPCIYVTLASFVFVSALAAQEKITYADHARAIMENKCFSCHNPDKKKGDLDLTTFAGVMTGGGGGSIVDPGNPEGSKLIGTITKKTEPYMPPEGAPLGDKDIDMLKKWIAGGVLDTANSLAKKSTKPKVELTVAAGTGKPEGPIAKPQDVLLEPVVVTPRPTAVTAMAASPWTSLIAFAAPKQILLYDTDARQLAGVFPYTEGYARSLKFSRSGSLLVMGGGRGGKFGNAIVWDVKTGKRVAEIGKESDTVMSADISPDHTKVVIGSPSKKVKVYDLSTGEELYTIAKHTEWVLCTQFSPDGILLGTADRNGNVFVWEAANGGEFFLLGQHKAGACTDLSWRSDSNVLASCSRDGTVILWEMNEGKQLKTWTAHNGGCESISFTPDGNLVTCGLNGEVTLWDINGTKKADLPKQPDVATRVAALYDSKAAVVANWLGEVKIVDFAAKAEAGALSSNPPKIDQRIALAEQRAGELTGKMPTLQQAAQAADADAKARDAALAKGKADQAATEARKNALPNEIKATEAALVAARTARDQAQKGKTTLQQQIQAFTAKQARIAELEKQLAPLATEAARFPTTEKALADLKAQKDAADTEQKAKPTDAPTIAKAKDLAAKVQAATADHQKVAQAKTRAEPLQKQIADQKAQLGAAPAAIETANKALADAEALIKAKTDAIAAMKAEGPKVEQALKNFPNVIKDLEAKANDGHTNLAKAQAAVKSATDEIAMMQKSVPLLKAAKFNVNVLAEKDALAKLEADVQAYTEGIKDNEAGKVDSAKRLEDSKKLVTELTASIPGLEAAAKKPFDELQPMEKSLTGLQTQHDQALAKSNEQKQVIAAKEAEVAALAKARDDASAAAKAAADDINKGIAKQQQAMNDTNQKLAAPAKALEEAKVTLTKLEAEVPQLKKAAVDAKALAEKTQAAIKLNDDALTAAWKAPASPTSQAAIEAAQKGLADARDNTPKTKVAAEQAAANAAAKDKALTDARNAAAAAEKTVAPLRNAVQAAQNQIATMQKTLADKQAIIAAAQKDFEAKAAPLNAIIAQAKAALAPLDKTVADAAAQRDALQKQVEAKRGEVGKAQAAAADAKAKKEAAEKAIAAATKDLPERDKNIAAAKTELAKLQPQLEPQRAKVKQLTEQYVAMLPK